MKDKSRIITLVISKVAALLLLLAGGVLIAVQTPRVQKRITERVLGKLEGGFDALFDCESVQIMPNGALSLKGLRIMDQDSTALVDTLLYIGEVNAGFSLRSILTPGSIQVSQATVRDVHFHLVMEESEWLTNLNRIFRIKSKEKRPEVGPELFRISRTKIEDIHFTMLNPKDSGKTYKGHGIDYDDMDLTAERVSGRNLRFVQGRLLVSGVEGLGLEEKCGYRIDRLKANLAVGQGQADITSIRLRDPYSDLSLKRYAMYFDSSKDFSDYVNRIGMKAEDIRGLLSLSTVSYLSGAFEPMGAALDFEGGSLNGYVNDFTLDNLQFTETLSGTKACLDGTVTGLPDFENLLLDLRLKNASFTTSGLNPLLAEFSAPGSKAPDITGIAPRKRIYLSATVRGPLKRLKAGLNLSCAKSKARLNADIRNLGDRLRPLELRAEALLGEVDPGLFLKDSPIGPTSMYCKAAGRFSDSVMDLTLDSLRVSSTSLFGSPYQDIQAKGELKDGAYVLNLESPSEGLRLSIQADGKMDPKAASYSLHLRGSADDLDLNALKLDQRTPSRLSAGLFAQLEFNAGKTEGNAAIMDIKATGTSGTKQIGDISLLAFNQDGMQNYRLYSDFADLMLSGGAPVSDLLSALQSATLRRELPALYTDTPATEGHATCMLDLKMHDSRELLSFIMPGLYIADSTSVTMTLEQDGSFYGNLYSSRLAYEKSFLKNADLQFDNLGSSLNVILSGTTLKAGDFEVASPSVSAYADDNTMELAIGFDEYGSAGGKGELYIDSRIYRDSLGTLVFKAHPLESYLKAGKELWTLGESDIVLTPSELFIRDFNIRNGEQAILIDGGVSRNRSDTLRLQISGLDLGLIDDFLPKKYGIRGKLDGRAFVTSDMDDVPGMLMDFRIDSLGVSDANAGRLMIAASIDDNGEDMNLIVRDIIDGRDALSASGVMFLDDGRMDISASADRFPLNVVAPFLEKVFSSVDGSISGGIRLQGDTQRLSTVSQNFNLNDASLRLKMTGVNYTVNGPLRLDSNALYLDGLRVSDSDKGSGTLSGRISHDHLKDINLDLGLDFDNMKLLDITAKDSPNLYGLLRAGGKASVSGEPQNMRVDVDLRSQGQGNVHIMTGEASAKAGTNLLTFTQKAQVRDAYEEMLDTQAEKTALPMDISIHGSVRIDPEVKAYAVLDKAEGNTASFSGNGLVSINLRPSKAVFDLNGYFNINEGNYQFSIPGILTKDFIVQQGGSIKFGGDIMDTEIDVSAIYRLKTSLKTLIGSMNEESNSIATKRQVDCILNISDRLSNPKLGFEINIPDLDPTTKSQVESALATDDKIQKQFIALLLMGSFIPDEASGVFNGSNLLMSNMTVLMSNQLNSILQRLEIPFDVGIGYLGSAESSNAFDVAISTQLFNDRVIVGGSVANKSYNGNLSNRDVVGDLDIQIKLDPSGRFRFNLFSHSADEYSSILDLSQRNGFGVSYQMEYNRFREFVRSVFNPSEAKAIKEKAAAAAAEQITIVIEDERETKAVSDTLSTGR